MSPPIDRTTVGTGVVYAIRNRYGHYRADGISWMPLRFAKLFVNPPRLTPDQEDAGWHVATVYLQATIERKPAS